MRLVCSPCVLMWRLFISFFFFFNDTAPTEIYPLPLHDALPISRCKSCCRNSSSSRLSAGAIGRRREPASQPMMKQDRKSTRLNSSHLVISYAVFCLKKKKPRKMHAEQRARRRDFHA